MLNVIVSLDCWVDLRGLLCGKKLWNKQNNLFSLCFDKQKHLNLFKSLDGTEVNYQFIELWLCHMLVKTCMNLTSVSDLCVHVSIPQWGLFQYNFTILLLLGDYIDRCFNFVVIGWFLKWRVFKMLFYVFFFFFFNNTFK